MRSLNEVGEKYVKKVAKLVTNDSKEKKSGNWRRNSQILKLKKMKLSYLL